MDPFTITLLIVMSVLASGSGSVAWRRAKKRRRERLRASLLRKFPAPDRYVSVFDVFWDLGASDYALKIMAAQRLIPRDPDDSEAVFDTILDRIEVHGSYSAFIEDVLEAIQEFYEEHRAAGHRRMLPTLEVRGRKLLPGATTSTSLSLVPAVPEEDGLPDGHLLDIALAERARSREDHAPGEGALVRLGDAASREVDVDELLRVDLKQMLRSALRGDLWREAERCACALTVTCRARRRQGPYLQSAEPGVGSGDNVFGNESGGDAVRQVQNGVDLGGNMCAGTPGC